MALSSGISVLSSQVPLTCRNRSSWGLVAGLRAWASMPGETVMALIVRGESLS